MVRMRSRVRFPVSAQKENRFHAGFIFESMMVDEKLWFGHKPINSYRCSVTRQAQKFISIMIIIENYDEQARFHLSRVKKT